VATVSASGAEVSSVKAGVIEVISSSNAALNTEWVQRDGTDAQWSRIKAGRNDDLGTSLHDHHQPHRR
jgi:hypothetical protein